MKTDIAIGVSALGLSLIGQAVPDFVPGMVSQFGALGLIFWIVVHVTMYAWPKEREAQAERMEKLMEMHKEEREAMQKERKEERAEMLTLFTKTLDQKREDYRNELAQERQSFESMLSKVACKADKQ